MSIWPVFGLTGGKSIWRQVSGTKSVQFDDRAPIESGACRIGLDHTYANDVVDSSSCNQGSGRLRV
jgi:hypothetical protein